MEDKSNRLLDSVFQSSESQYGSNGYEPVTEIALDSLRASQHLFIQTANSTYSFAVTDPSQRLGLLIGGPLAERRVVVFLAGGRSRRRDAKYASSTLRVGSNAVFLIASESGLKRVITSRITRLIQK